MKTNRIDIIDSLRGLSLFGILLTHCVTQFFGVMPEENREILNHNILDSFFTYSISLFLGAKFFLVFAFLFGVSFWIQVENNKDRLKKFNVYFIKRMVVLIFFGMLNYCFFQGDILMVYGALSVSLLFIQNMKTDKILLLAVFLLSGLPRFSIYSYQLIFGDVESFALGLNPDPVFMSNFVAATTYSFIDIVKLNFENWSKMISIFQLGYFGRSYQVVGCFLLGVVTHRGNFFSSLIDSSYLKEKLFIRSIITIVLSLCLLIYLYTLNSSLDFTSFSGIIMVTIYDWFNISFTIVLVLLFVGYSKNLKLKIFYDLLKWPGRMSLSVYVMQSVFFTAFYFNWGLNMFNAHGATVSVLIAILFFGGQCLFSFYWLQYFKQGPLEAIWKKLAFYGSI
ncbi:MAG: DUF418 domain-containing protein [Halobacteriovoraceae bacterium]|nr:DUF418 domain-containing protein [Halobacteriovoraceae bacterium]